MANVGSGDAGKTLIGNGNGAGPKYASIGTNSGLTAFGFLVAQGNSPFVSISPSATIGIPVISQGAASNPGYGTAVVAGGGTGQTTLTNHGVLLGQGTSAVVAMAAGSAGQIIRSGGASADPSYSTATYPATAGSSGNVLTSDGTNWTSATPAPSNFTLISTTTAANQATVDITAGFSSTYKMMKIIITGLQLANAGGQALWMRCSTDGGGTFDAGNNYAYNNQYYASDSSTDWNRSGADSKILLVFPGPLSSSSTDSGSVDMDIFNISQATLYTTFLSNNVIDAAGVNSNQRVSGSYKQAASVNALRFLAASGNVISGKFYLYGIT